METHPSTTLRLCVILLVTATAANAEPATGPLRVHPTNPRYFTDGTKGPHGSLKAVYLTGSHHWNNLQDSAKLGQPLTNRFDYDGYLRFLEKFHHNFMRMWSWEVGENDLYYEPAPWVRAGPGTANDGKPKFDLQQFNPEYFARLRSRVVAARDRGIYVSVMLFQGWSIYSHGYGNPWPAHPFNQANNVNGIDGDANHDGEGKEVHTLAVPAVTRRQEAYVRQVIDTLNDLDNVLYEITNETALWSKDWQYHIVRFIKEYEATKPKQHPVGITAFDSGREGSMAALFSSPADWISPQNDGSGGDYQNDPPAADGRKVILSDTDHLWGVGGDRVWAWKSFTRGHHPIYMDPLRQENWVRISETDMEGARQAMGHTRVLAERMNLAAMTPQPTLASTRYCLAHPGKAYLVYAPRGGDTTVDLTSVAGTIAVEWLHPDRGTVTSGASIQGGASRSLRAPFAGDAVLYLKTQQSEPKPKTTADYFVSPDGNDNWTGRLADPGTNDGPFATITRAREAVRALLKAGKHSQGIRVLLRGGVYYLDQTVEFGPEDSGTEQAPVVYAAAPDENVVVSGGRRLVDGRWGEVNGHKAWMIDIPEVRDDRWRFRQFFVNGERRPRTRLPKLGEYRIESLPGYTGDFLRSPTKHFVYAPGHIVPTWRNLRDVEVVGITRWLDNRLPIESVDGETRTVTFDRPSLFALVSSAVSGDGTAKPAVYWVENVFEALDTPGQWYLDRPQGRLYYLPRPGEDMTTAQVIAPRLTQVLRVIGRPGARAHDLRFENITFAHTEWQPPPDYASSLQAGVEVPGAVFFDYAERCSVTGGAIEHIGNCGIEVNVGCMDVEISRNRITDVGAGGIRIGHFFSWETDGSGRLTERGKQRKAAMPKGPHSERITVSDNVIAHCGRFTPEAAGVFVGDNAHCKIIHNRIYDLFWSGICVGSVQDFGPNNARSNVVEFNHVHDIGQGVLSDVAGIYTCSTPGTRIRFNRVHDVRRRDYGGWGIYPDEGAHDLLIQNNLVYRCQDGALFAHHNRNITAENNIFAFNHRAQIERGGIGGFELTCRRNLIYYREGQAIGAYGGKRSGTNVCLFDRNLYWNASGAPVLFGGRSLAEWRALGQDRNSLIADPLFVDATQGDFRLRAGSPAGKVGFEPWDLSKVGPADDGH